MLAHAPECECGHCAAVRRHSVPVEQRDRDLLAGQWELWISSRDGEAAALRAGRDGNLGSSRFVALQAIARTRLEYDQASVRAGSAVG